MNFLKKEKEKRRTYMLSHYLFACLHKHYLKFYHGSIYVNKFLFEL